MNAELEITHTIVEMQRGETKGSRSPMWRCVTADGEKVNVFQHADPARDTYHLFEGAGYGDDMLAMSPEERLMWNAHPIAVTMQRDGRWWEVVAVMPRPDGAQPECDTPEHRLYRCRAIDHAAHLLSPELQAVVWDVETTGVGWDDEIISIAVVEAVTGEVLLQTLITPQNIERVRVANAIHGITAEMLVDAPTLPEAYAQIHATLNGRHWITYNAEFDTAMLERGCVRHGLIPPYSSGIHCAMRLFSEWYGEWHPGRREYVSKSLSFATTHLGLTQLNAHHALDDVRTTLAMLESISRD